LTFPTSQCDFPAMHYRYRTILPLAAMLAAAVALSSCAPRLTIRGNLPRDAQLAKIVFGEQSREEVAAILGTPSTQGTFDDRIWYYISRKTEKFAFFEAQVVDQQIVVVYFTDNDIVQAIHRYNTDDLRQIDMVERQTPTVGKELSILEQFIGNLGRFGSAGGGGGGGGY
jgi:outer membrane protein assembly factor BamE (lipoprotein component of BamABCDE complex)